MCKKVGDKKYSVINTTIVCYDDMYMNVVLPIYDSILILLLIIIPLILFLHLRKNKAILNRIII